VSWPTVLKSILIDTLEIAYERRVIPTAGHLFPREAPETVIEAIRELAGYTHA
jgi:pimeloyl-ACP methyl ester carboxylesterase